MSVLISASTNPPQKNNLEEYLLKLDKTAIDYIHCDVMDGRFVFSKTFGYKQVAKIKKLTTKPLDVHLMAVKSHLKIKKYVKAGANILTIHYEAFKNKHKLVKCLEQIKKSGVFAGLSFCPSTSVLEILPFIYYCDVLLVMSVVPGKSGQEFMPETLVRINTINEFLKKQKLEVVVEVDGGVNEKTLPALLEKNVPMVVMGNYLYKAKNLKSTIEKIKALPLVKAQKSKAIKA